MDKVQTRSWTTENKSIKWQGRGFETRTTRLGVHCPNYSATLPHNRISLRITKKKNESFIYTWREDKYQTQFNTVTHCGVRMEKFVIRVVMAKRDESNFDSCLLRFLLNRYLSSNAITSLPETVFRDLTSLHSLYVPWTITILLYLIKCSLRTPGSNVDARYNVFSWN